jgi:hypothetical protein
MNERKKKTSTKMSRTKLIFFKMTKMKNQTCEESQLNDWIKKNKNFYKWKRNKITN